VVASSTAVSEWDLGHTPSWATVNGLSSPGTTATDRVLNPRVRLSDSDGLLYVVRNTGPFFKGPIDVLGSDGSLVRTLDVTGDDLDV